MTAYYAADQVTLHHGDALEVLRAVPSNSLDAVVTDPPYGLSNTSPDQVADALKAWVTGDDTAVPAKRGGFMGNDWDSFVPPPAIWAECLRVLKPGGHMAVFAGTRTQDLMGLSIRLAGFEIRDTLGWVYGSGFPKSLNVSKAIDKAAASATPEAHQWEGWGTALKPAIEPIILARKPLDGTVAANVLAHGVGGLNIDASRVGGDAGRFPANVVLDEHAAAEMDRQSGDRPGYATQNHVSSAKPGMFGVGSGGDFRKSEQGYNDHGGASRFFPVFKYQAKAPKRERPVIVREDGTKVQHPTVKPLELMKWLVTLVTPEGGTLLDPFAGTGTTLHAARDKGFGAVGMEQDRDYCDLIVQRLTDEEER